MAHISACSDCHGDIHLGTSLQRHTFEYPWDDHASWQRVQKSREMHKFILIWGSKCISYYSVEDLKQRRIQLSAEVFHHVQQFSQDRVLDNYRNYCLATVLFLFGINSVVDQIEIWLWHHRHHCNGSSLYYICCALSSKDIQDHD